MKNLVKNVPAYAHDDNHKYWVVTEDGEDLWFYDAYATADKAERVAMDLDKRVVEN